MQHLLALTVAGVDTAKFLQGYVTCDLSTIQPLRGQTMALTDINGRVIANGWCYGTSTEVALVFHHSLIETVKSHLEKYLVFSRSQFVAERAHWILTPTSAQGEIELAPFGWGLEQANDAANQTNHLTVHHEFPIIQQESSGLFLPQMINLTALGAVSFTKGCYLGQEIVARAENRGRVKRQLFRATLPKDGVFVGDQVEVSDRGKCTVVGIDLDQALLVGRIPNSTDQREASARMEPSKLNNGIS